MGLHLSPPYGMFFARRHGAKTVQKPYMVLYIIEYLREELCFP